MKFTKTAVHNIYKEIQCPSGAEKFKTIVEKGSFKIKRIVSNGAKSPDGFWYDQKEDEFVLLLQGKARLLFEKGQTVILKSGDYILVPKRVKHRIEYTSSKPKCVWICVFGKFT